MTPPFAPMQWLCGGIYRSAPAENGLWVSKRRTRGLPAKSFFCILSHLSRLIAIISLRLNLNLNYFQYLCVEFVCYYPS